MEDLKQKSEELYDNSEDKVIEKSERKDKRNKKSKKSKNKELNEEYNDCGTDDDKHSHKSFNLGTHLKAKVIVVCGEPQLKLFRVNESEGSDERHISEEDCSQYTNGLVIKADEWLLFRDIVQNIDNLMNYNN
ncbi:uncharacterized protein LOC128960392 [Oppia nitens]|uniref:uncharacterized protein LOC128960392 n=1 Tax=Oppia nitens TaxID=1686743 RepID=UPI0023DB1E24|nr:uncharacterized protein LOC128960392 [Oppia nitens]